MLLNSRTGAVFANRFLKSRTGSRGTESICPSESGRNHGQARFVPSIFSCNSVHKHRAKDGRFTNKEPAPNAQAVVPTQICTVADSRNLEHRHDGTLAIEERKFANRSRDSRTGHQVSQTGPETRACIIRGWPASGPCDRIGFPQCIDWGRKRSNRPCKSRTRFPLIADRRNGRFPVDEDLVTEPRAVAAQQPAGGEHAIRPAVTPKQFLFHAIGSRTRTVTRAVTRSWHIHEPARDLGTNAAPPCRCKDTAGSARRFTNLKMPSVAIERILSGYSQTAAPGGAP